MIRKLQRKFVFIAMGSLILVLTVILGAISGVNFYTMNRETEGLLMLLADNEGRFPEFKPDKPPRHERPFAFEMTEETGPMVFSALPYTPHEIENAMHPYELPPVHYTVVRVAKAQMGVGGDDSWGAQTHPEYLLQTDKTMQFSFVWKGVVSTEA